MSEESLVELVGPTILRNLLGYLDFSEGKPDARFRSDLNAAFEALDPDERSAPWADLHLAFRQGLAMLRSGGAEGIGRLVQAEAVVDRTLGDLLPAYRRHHQDLLHHQTDRDLWQPFFLARAFEAVLAQGSPWDQPERILRGGLKLLNDFVGWRPIALLENGRRGEVYEHERVCPIPLYWREAGFAHGRYRRLLTRAVDILRDADPQLLQEAGFVLDHLEELALDPRGYDFGHPVDRRPNYCFGEWDPEHLDAGGRYDRFVLRQVVLDGLLQRIAEQDYHPLGEEYLEEAAVVLAGTILMASGVTGGSLQAHDSSVSLTNLVPRIARLREAFYQRALQKTRGTHAERLQQEAQTMRQPFGGARRHLNQVLARGRALQLQNRHLALFLAELGYPAGSRRRIAGTAPASVRLLTEIHILLTTGRLQAERGQVPRAAEVLPRVEDLLRRGIACGALADPWNILGFQGQFPRSPAVEDSIRDSRVDDLVHAVEELFDLYARIMSEGAATGTFAPTEDLAKDMRRLADWWDRFATTTVQDIPQVHGAEAAASAELVAQALAQWRARGAATADLAFWKENLERFRTPKSFALVVEALLQQQDLQASMALLMTWLGQFESMPLEDGEHSFHQLALRWMLELCAAAGVGGESRALPEHGVSGPTAGAGGGTALARKFFDYLEANAEEFWNVPRLDILGLGEDAYGEEEDGDDLPEAEMAEEEDDEAEEEDEDDLFGAAYEDMTYQDATDDDNEAEVLDFMPQKDFDLAEEARRLEVRLRFLATLARLWNIVTRILRTAPSEDRSLAQEALASWLPRARTNFQGLLGLLDTIHEHEIPKPMGSYEALVEFDRMRMAKERLLGLVIATCMDQALAVGALRGSLDAETRVDLSPEEIAGPAWETVILDLERSLIRGEAEASRRLLSRFMPIFRQEPLLYVPLGAGGHPRQILRASLAQTILRGLAANLPRQGLLRETWQLIRLAHEMEQTQTLTGPRVTEFDRLFQVGLQAVVEALVEAALREDRDPAHVVVVLEALLEPFLAVWIEHSKTLRVAMLEVLTSEKEWQKLADFIRRYGRDLFQARFMALGNLRGILHRGVPAWLEWVAENPEGDQPLRLVEDLDRKVPRQEAAKILQIILQTVIENYDHFRDYNSTTVQSDYGDNLHQLFDFLRIKANYERNAWQYRPLGLVHEVLARRHSQAAALWREHVQILMQDNARQHLRELERLEHQHGIRLATIRDRVEEGFVRPMTIDRLCALVQPAYEAARERFEGDEPLPLEIEMEPLAAAPTGVGLDVPPWILRLESELNRVRTSQSVLVSLAETLFQVPRRQVPFKELADDLRDWKKGKSPGA